MEVFYEHFLQNGSCCNIYQRIKKDVCLNPMKINEFIFYNNDDDVLDVLKQRHNGI